MDDWFEIPGFILHGLFSLLLCCAVKRALFTFAAMNSYVSFYSIFFMNISAQLGVINPSKHNMYYHSHFRPRRLNHRARFL